MLTTTKSLPATIKKPFSRKTPTDNGPIRVTCPESRYGTPTPTLEVAIEAHEYRRARANAYRVGALVEEAMPEPGGWAVQIEPCKIYVGGAWGNAVRITIETANGTKAEADAATKLLTNVAYSSACRALMTAS